MRFDVVSIFPEIVENYFSGGILHQALKSDKFQLQVWDLRMFGSGNYKRVDEKVFGGGGGMVLQFEPIAKAISEISRIYRSEKLNKSLVVATTAGGQKFKQSVAKSWVADIEAITILCGRYEGFDQRILDVLVDQQISLGNFVITGGELAALACIDATSRLLPGVLGNPESYLTDSFYEDDSVAQYPQYTRPEVVTFDGIHYKVPDVLLSGDHAKIAEWRRQQLVEL